MREIVCGPGFNSPVEARWETTQVSPPQKKTPHSYANFPHQKETPHTGTTIAHTKVASPNTPHSDNKFPTPNAIAHSND